MSDLYAKTATPGDPDVAMLEDRARELLGIGPADEFDRLVASLRDRGAIEGGQGAAYADYIRAAKDPAAALAEINAASFYAKRMGIRTEEALANLPSLSEAWWGQARTPVSDWDAIRGNLELGAKTLRLGQLWAQARDSGMTPELQTEIDTIEDSLPPPDQIARGLPTEIFKAAAQSIPYSVSALPGGLAGAAASSALQVALPGSSVLIGLLSFGAQALVNAEVMQGATGGLEYRDMVKAGIHPDMAAAASRWSGLLQDAVESDAVMGLLPNPLAKASLVGALQRLAGKGALRGAVRNPLTQFVLRQGSRAIGEGAEEALQQAISEAATEAVRLASNEYKGTDVDPRTWAEVGKALADNFVAGAMASLPMGAMGEPFSIAQDVAEYGDWKATEALRLRAEAKAKTAAEEASKPAAAGKAEGAVPQPAKPLKWKELASKEPQEDGSIRAQLRGGSDASAKTASVQADYTWNPDSSTVTVDDVKVDAALAKKEPAEAMAQMGAAVRWLREQYPGATIAWEPSSKTGKALKTLLEGEAADFFAASYDPEAARAEAEGAGRRGAFVGKLVDVAGLERQTAEDVATLLDARATKLGMDTDSFISRYFTDDMIQAGLSPKGAARVAKGDIGNPYGQTSFWVEGKEIPGVSVTQLAVQAKATLHFAEKGNTSGVIHELMGHGLIHTLTDSERTLFEKYVGKAMPEWQVAEHERVATDLERYFETGKAPTKELQDVFRRLAEFVKQVIESWISQKRLSKDAIAAFDALFAATDREAEVAAREAQAKADKAAGVYRFGRQARRKRQAIARTVKANAQAARPSTVEDFYKVEGWHGTKNRIIGRFSLGKAGAGEGGDAYGWGAYIAEGRPMGRQVARTYAKMTADGSPMMADGGPQYEVDGVRVDDVRRSIGYLKDVEGKSEEEVLREARKYSDAPSKAEIRRIYGAIKRIPDRRVYRMVIEDPRGQERFLDYDRPVPEEQFDLVLEEAGLTRERLAAEYDPATLRLDDIRYVLGRFSSGEYKLKHHITGRPYNPRAGWVLYKALANSLGSFQAASEFLDRAGFTGGTYIGDFAKSDGEGVRDYVIFNDAYLHEPVEDELFGGARRGTVEVGGYETKSEKDGSLTVYGDPDEIRSLMPAGVVGKAGTDEVSFSSSQRPRVLAALKGESLIYSRRGQVHDNPRYSSGARAGQYIGAPEAYNTPAKINKLRKILDQLAREGAAGRYWYENSGRAVLAAVGGVVEDAKKFAALLAIYSPQAKVDSNTTFAIRAWAQYKAGQPIKVKTGVQDRQATELLYEGKPWAGEKTGNFNNNLLREIDAAAHSADKMGVTVDMWMMRAAGYDTDKPTTAAYRFVENETNRLAKQLGWEPQQVQAAIWVAMKARTENKQVKADTEAESEKKGWIRYDEKVKRVVIDEARHRQNWLRHAMALKVGSDDTSRAKFDFSDGLARHQGQVSWEARPGRTTGILTGINDAFFEVQQRFQRDALDALLDASGSDVLAAKIGLLKSGGVDAPGVWQSEVAAGRQELMAMSPAQGANADVGVLPEQADLIETYCAVIGILFRQEGVGWHRPFWNGRVSEENGLQVDIGRPLTADEAKSLWESVDRTMRGAGFAGWEGSAGMISSANGMRLVSFGLTDNPAAIKLFKKAAEAWIEPLEIEGHMDQFRSDGNLVTNNWTEDRDGQAYRSRISRAGRSDILQWAVDVLGPNVQAVFDKYADLGFGNPGRIPGLRGPAVPGPLLLEGGVDAQGLHDQAAAPDERAGQGPDRGEHGPVRDGEAGAAQGDRDLRVAEAGLRPEGLGEGPGGDGAGTRAHQADGLEPLFGGATRTDTPEFRAWFGDSKVVDAEGKPLRVYHGTYTSLDAFTVGHKDRHDAGWLGAGAYFTSSTMVAAQYADYKASIRAKGTGSQILPVYLRIENPYHATERDKARNHSIEYQAGREIAELRIREWTDDLKKQGYDGVIYDDGVIVEYVAFDPDQIKSVFNRGTWDANDPRLLFGGSGRDDIEVAAGFSSYAEFAASFNAAHPLPEEFSADDREAYLKAAWAAAHPKRQKGETVSPKKADEAFLASLEANGHEGLKAFLEAVGSMLRTDRKVAKAGLDPVDVAGIRAAEGKPLTDAGLKTVMATIRRSPGKYRARFAEVTGDPATKAQLEAERSGAAPEDAPNFGPIQSGIILRNALSRLRAAASELDDEELQELYLDGKVGYGQAREEAKAAQAEIKQLRKELDLAGDALKDWRQRFTMGERTISERNKALRALRSELRKAQAAAKVRKTPEALARVDDLEAQVAGLRADIKERIRRLPAGAVIRDTSYAAAREAAAEKKAQIEARLKELAAKRAARDTAIALAKKILAPIAKATDWRVAQEIKAIQRSIDPHFRRNLLTKPIEYLRRIFGESPDLSRILSPEILDRLEKRPLNDWTIAELEELNRKVEALRELGKLRLAERKLAKRMARLDRQDMLVRRLKESGKYLEAPMTGSREFEEAKDKEQSLLRKWDRSLETMARLARELDNGQEKGWWYNTLVERERDAYRVESDNFHRRWGAVERKMEALGITPEALYERQIKVGDWTINASDAIGLYIGLQDADTAAKIVYGNMLNEDQRKTLSRGELEALGVRNLDLALEAAQQLTAAERELADFLVADADREFDRLSEATYQYENREPPKVAVYFPNEVRGRSGEEKLVDQMRQDLLDRTPRLGRGVQKGMTIPRIKIAPEHQLPINLDALAVYRRGIERQEHYIAYAEYVKESKLLIQNDRTASQLRYLVRQTHGQGALDYMDEWLDEVANPKSYTDYSKTLSGFEQAFRALRGPLGTAYLGFRTSTAIKQLITSPLPYLPYAGGAMVGTMARHLNLAEYLRQVKVVKEKSAFVRDRQMSTTAAAIKEYAQADGVSKPMKLAARYSLVLLEAADMWAVVTGWTAVYEKTVAELTAKGGLDAAAIEAAAVREADRVTIESQPTGRRADVAPAFKSHSEVQKFLLQFQGPLNVVYNQLFHDVPADIAEGRLGRAAAIVSGYLATGAILALLAAPRGDDGEDEGVRALRRGLAGALRQPADAVPLLGSYAGDFLEAMVTGERRFRASGDVFPGVAKIFAGAGSALSAEDEAAFWAGLMKFAEGSTMLAGLPSSAIKEYYRALFEGDLGALAGRPKE